MQGLRDWQLQRLSAMLIAVFALPMLSLWFLGYLVEDYDWYLFLSSYLGRGLSLLGLFGYVIHARLGMWVVITDYVPRSYQRIVIWLLDIWLLALLITGLGLFWVL